MNNRFVNQLALLLFMSAILFSCTGGDKAGVPASSFTGKEGEVKLIVLAPGHFHASLLQKNAIQQVNDSVFVYAAAEDAGLKQYLSTVESFNQREDNPTSWNQSIYTGKDFLEKMVESRNGNVVVLAGNNRDKTEYILHAVDAGLNVLSDKPMAINSDDFQLLEKAYTEAANKGIFLFDMMTERYDMLNIIEKELINDLDFFGELQVGTPNKPAVSMESVHHFYKEVAGVPLIRPAWYYDVEQQGEGIADVTTHLIDLLFWKCFPGEPINYNSDISGVSATHWPTVMSLEQFTRSTGEGSFPEYLHKYLDEELLKVYANGTINFAVNNHHVGLKVHWNYQAPEGGGDTFVSEIIGTKAILKTEQSSGQNFVKQLYAQSPGGIEESVFSVNLQEAIERIQAKYPFVTATPDPSGGRYLINIPVEEREGHESHFTYVAESFFNYLVTRDMPGWEISNTLAKYYITTKAVEVAVDDVAAAE